MVELAITFIGVVAVVGLVFVLPIAGVRDARRHPDEAWARIGQSRSTWTGLMLCGPVFFVPPVSLAGIAAAALYWTSKRRLLLQPAVAVAAPAPRRFVI